MHAIAIPPMFEFTHPQWQMKGCAPWPPIGRSTIVMWPTLTAGQKEEIAATTGDEAAGWMILTWRKHKLPAAMLHTWERKSTLMQGHDISRRKE
eukprot:2624887-Rhodomonas_salina.1